MRYQPTNPLPLHEPPAQIIIKLQRHYPYSTPPTGDTAIGAAFQVGDRVKLILDKERGPDNQWHGKKGEIIDIQFDDAGSVTGDAEDNFMYQIRLDDGVVPDLHFRRKDLKPLD